MEWIDLSLPFFSGMPVYPGDPEVIVDLACSHEKDQFQLSRLMMGSHTGTHIDAPRHFLPAGAAVDQLPLSSLAGPAYVASWNSPGDSLIDLSGMDLSGMHPGDALLLATGWDSRFATAGYYDGIPQFTTGSTDFLKQLGIRLFGLDLPTVCEKVEPPDPFRMHVGLLGSGMVIVEGLADLRPLAGKRIEFFAFPLRLVNGDGCPVRACARLIG